MAGRRIEGFFGEYRWLSNFWRHWVSPFGDGFAYPTNEHAYVAAKTVVMEERRFIAELKTPGDAKRAGRRLAIRKDWEDVKVNVMRACIAAKFTEDNELGRKLLATEEAEIVELNKWGDEFWGVSEKTGRGLNTLGWLIMERRAELRGLTGAGSAGRGAVC